MAQLVEWQIRDLMELGSSPSWCSWCFWRCRCRIRSGVNSRQLWRTQRQAERRAAWPGTARDVTARYGLAASAPPASLPPRWRNMRSLLLWPISFCIFGMCSPWRKSAATVWTVYHGAANRNMASSWNRGLVKPGSLVPGLAHDLNNPLITETWNQLKTESPGTM